MPARDRFLTANRLRLHLLEWGAGSRVVLCLHGVQEHAHAWDFVAPRIVAAGYHVFALDWRGHGDSDWVGAGGYYHFADYTADLAAVVRDLGGRVALVGHSMGGNAALTYAGTEPERVAALVSIEGLGPPDAEPESAPERFRTWLDDLERAERRGRRELTLAEGASRLRERFPLWSEATASHMAELGTVERGGKRVWKFDPLHQTRSPQPFYLRQAQAFWRRISCPVLYVEGTSSFISIQAPEIAARASMVRALRVTIDGAGHHPHLEKPHELAKAVIDFLDAALRQEGD